MITIRQARKDEIQKLQMLNDEAFADNTAFDPDVVLNWAQSENGTSCFTNLLNNPDGYCLIAEDNGRVIGYLAAAPKVFDDRKSKYIDIQNLGVIKEYRSQGIGQQLMDQCLTWAKGKGYQKAWLRCYFKNTSALAFYKKNEFSEISVSLEKDL